jgi:hypothetical protein
MPVAQPFFSVNFVSNQSFAMNNDESVDTFLKTLMSIDNEGRSGVEFSQGNYTWTNTTAINLQAITPEFEIFVEKHDHEHMHGSFECSQNSNGLPLYGADSRSRSGSIASSFSGNRLLK